jgi:geranylgeranyl reductase family protein
MSGAAFDADVIVVGGGPAGAATAIHLARAGLSVLILERARFPRDKVCGDFVGPVGLVELERIGVAHRGVPHWNEVDRAALFADGVELVTYTLPRVEGLPSYGCVVPRLILDATIAGAAQRAGARIEEDTCVAGFRSSSEGVEVVARRAGSELRRRARVLVGADGSGSSIARIVRGCAPQRDEFLVAARAYFGGVEGPAQRCDLSFTTVSFPGYSWVFPTAGGQANVGVGMVVETFPAAKEHMRDLLPDLVERDPALRSRLHAAGAIGEVAGWPLVTYSGRTPVVSDRVLLVGDAAGLINPLNGEGIQWALCSARWAAEAVAQFVRSGGHHAQTLTAYGSRLRREIGTDMLLARLVVRAIANRALNPLWLTMLRGIAARARADSGYALATGGAMAGIVAVREAFATGVLLASANAIAAEIAGACRSATHLGLRAGTAQLVRTWRPAAQMFREPDAAIDWMREVIHAAREVVASRNASAQARRQAP